MARMRWSHPNQMKKENAMSVVFNECELFDSELDAVSGGDKTMGQVAAKVIAGTELPNPPCPLQPAGLDTKITIFLL